MDEIRCPRCGSTEFSIERQSMVEMVFDCICPRCGSGWMARALDAPPVAVQGRENGYYWIRLNDTGASPWEIGEWDGRVWARCADADPVDETELAAVGPKIPPYTGG